jgi:FkbM family methyltransferase
MAALLALFEDAEEGFVFFDVGANVGLYAASCAALFEPAAVVAFEPTPSTAEVARRIMIANGLGVTVEELALGAEPGLGSLYLSAKSDSSNSLVAGFKESSGSMTVAVDTLDGYVSRSGLMPTIVKIDVETYEPEVLAGARRTIEGHRPHLIVEVLNRNGHDHGVEISAAMKDLGYCYYRLGPHVPLEPSDRIIGQRRTKHQDWLLAPAPLRDGFEARMERWASAIESCTGRTNGRLPLVATARAVHRTLGWRGVGRSLRKRLRNAPRRTPTRH